MERGNQLGGGESDLGTASVEVRIGRLHGDAERTHHRLGPGAGVESLEPVERLVASESIDAEDAHETPLSAISYLLSEARTAALRAAHLT